jgi:hypothetical protein
MTAITELFFIEIVDIKKWKPASSQLVAGFGAVTPRQKPEDWQKVQLEMEEAMAEKVAVEDR